MLSGPLFERASLFPVQPLRPPRTRGYEASVTAEPSSLLRVEALVRVQEPPEDRLRAAERRLRAALDEVTALDAELENLSEALAAFSRDHDHALADAYAELENAHRLVTRLQQLQDAVRTLREVLRDPTQGRAGQRRSAAGAARRRKRWTAPPELDDADEAEAQAAADAGVADAREDEAKLLKRLFRRLARVLHPDLARDDAERARLHGLMAQVNEAWERGDRTTLELLADKVGAGEPPETLTEDERLAHLERRSSALEQAARSLRTQREQLCATATFRLRQEHARRAAEGRDYFEETGRELVEEEAAARADGWHRLASLQRAVAALNTEWGQSMDDALERPKAGRALRAFDPVLESPLVRRGLERLEERRASEPARALARTLEERVSTAPWEVALTLLAYFAERALRPPEGLRTQQAWKDRYEALRAAWPQAPGFEQALTLLPDWLEVGMRVQQRQVQAGLQLRDAALAAGVSIALEGDGVAALAREVFLQLGPVELCKGCEAPRALVHLLRTRGLDELNALVCPSCGKVARRYFIFSRNDGIEALQPDALKLEVVAEQVVRFAGAAIGFQLLPSEREALTAGAVLDRFVDCYVVPYKLELTREALELHLGGQRLRSNARIPGGAVPTLRLSAKAPLSAKEALSLLKSRIERRFRPDAP